MVLRIVAAALGFVTLMGVLPGSARGDEVSSPGKSTAAISHSGTDFSSPQIISVQLEKGKKKRLVVVSGTLSVFDPGTLTARVVVNGEFANPTTLLTQTCSSTCTLSGTWWIDLDAEEAENPGMFINVPLNIDFRVDSSNIFDPYTASVTATMLKK